MAAARAREIDGKMVVLKGSTARKQGTPSWDSCKALRAELESAGRIIADPTRPNLLLFAEDVEFSSPSAAASVALCANTSGRITWRAESSGQTYQQWHESKLKNTPAAVTA